MLEEQNTELGTGEQTPEQSAAKVRTGGGRGTLRGFFAGAVSMLAVCLLAAAVIGRGWFAGSAGGPTDLGSELKLRSILRVIEEKYAGEVEAEDLTDGMYRGVIAGLKDPYSAYYTREEYAEVSSAQQGYYSGIGITVQLGEDCIEVVEVKEDSPAMRAGILPGDRITRIDGTDLAGLSLSEAVALIKQEESETAQLVLMREGEDAPLTFTVEKERMETNSVSWEMMEDGIGYLAITEFIQLTPEQFRQAYADLTAQGMRRLIIDLRDNPGGLMVSVCDTLRQILPEGRIVYTEDKYGNRSEYSCDGESVIDIPLAVLVNGNSASASEIFAGAVKDYGLGTIVGTTTYGKGIVQDVFELPDGSMVKLTIAHYYTPNGNDIHKVGIEPDVTVEPSEEEDDDPQLAAAVKLLRQEADEEKAG